MTADWLSRILSLVVVVAYAISTCRQGGVDTCGPLLALAIPLALIWFGDRLGESTGWLGRSYVDQQSPGCLVKAMGWILLLLPLAITWITGGTSWITCRRYGRYWRKWLSFVVSGFERG